MISEFTEKYTKYCNEDINKIENYDIAVNSDCKYIIHHRLELEDEFGNKRKKSLSKKEMIDKNIYYNRPSKELIFLSESEHRKIHYPFIKRNDNWESSYWLGKHRSEETKEKLRLYRLGRKHTKETREKMSLTRKGRFISEETKKKLSESNKGKNAKPIRCLELNLIFDSSLEASVFFGVTKAALCSALKKNQRCCKCHWEYI